MSIVNTLSQSEFMDLLKADEYANWSYDGAKALFDYYDQLSDDTGEPIEFDRVAIRCDWSEYDSLAQAYKEYRYDYTYVEGEAREYFDENTTLIELDNGHVLVQVF